MQMTIFYRTGQLAYLTQVEWDSYDAQYQVSKRVESMKKMASGWYESTYRGLNVVNERLGVRVLVDDVRGRGRGVVEGVGRYLGTLPEFVSKRGVVGEWMGSFSRSTPSTPSTSIPLTRILPPILNFLNPLTLTLRTGMDTLLSLKTIPPIPILLPLQTYIIRLKRGMEGLEWVYAESCLQGVQGVVVGIGSRVKEIGWGVLQWLGFRVKRRVINPFGSPFRGYRYGVYEVGYVKKYRGGIHTSTPFTPSTSRNTGMDLLGRVKGIFGAGDKKRKFKR